MRSVFSKGFYMLGKSGVLTANVAIKVVFGVGFGLIVGSTVGAMLNCRRELKA